MKHFTIRKSAIIAFANLCIINIIVFPYPSKCKKLMTAHLARPHAQVTYGLLPNNGVIEMSDIMLNYIIFLLLGILLSFAIWYCLSQKKIVSSLLAIILIFLQWSLIVSFDVLGYE